MNFFCLYQHIPPFRKVGKFENNWKLLVDGQSCLIITYYVTVVPVAHQYILYMLLGRDEWFHFGANIPVLQRYLGR